MTNIFLLKSLLLFCFLRDHLKLTTKQIRMPSKPFNQLLFSRILTAESFASRKWFNWSFRKKVVVFRRRRRCWTENQFVRHDSLKVVRATLSGTITLFTPSTTTQWYFCDILPYLQTFNFWFLPARTLAFPCKISRPLRNFCLFACLNFKLGLFVFCAAWYLC